MKKDESLSWVKNNAAVSKSKSAVLIIGNALFSVCGVLFALLCRGAIDHAVSGEPEIMLGSAVGLAVIAVIQLFLRILCNGIDESARARIETDLRSGLLEKLMKKEYEDVSGFSGEELSNRMFADTSIISEGAVCIFPSLVNMVARLVCAAAAMLLLDPEFGLLFIAAGTVFFLVSRLLGGKIKKLRRSVNEKDEEARLFARETFEGMLVVRTFGAERKIIDINRQKQDGYYNSRMKRRAASIAAGAGFGFAFQAGYLYTVIWGAFGILGGTMTFGTLVALLQLVDQVQTPFGGLSALMMRYNGMLGSAERFMELECLPDGGTAAKTLAPDDFEGLSVENVSFYHGENQIISDAGFDIERGETVSVSDVSGKGKTALFMLMLGACRPHSGSIRFFSRQGEYSAGVQTRGLIAYVPRESRMFSGTIGENIAFFNESARTDEIRSAAKTACALELIEDLPEGFETRIGENGTKISDGLRQRIAVAQAVLSGAPIIILDGSTDELDEASEASVLKNIGELKNRTVISAVYREPALKACGRHLSLRDGKLYEEKKV